MLLAVSGTAVPQGRLGGHLDLITCSVATNARALKNNCCCTTRTFAHQDHARVYIPMDQQKVIAEEWRLKNEALREEAGSLKAEIASFGDTVGTMQVHNNIWLYYNAIVNQEE